MIGNGRRRRRGPAPALDVLHVIPGVAAAYGGPSQAVRQMCEALNARAGAVRADIVTTDAGGQDGSRLRVPLERPVIDAAWPLTRIRFFRYVGPEFGGEGVLERGQALGGRGGLQGGGDDFVETAQEHDPSSGMGLWNGSVQERSDPHIRSHSAPNGPGGAHGSGAGQNGTSARGRLVDAGAVGGTVGGGLQ